MNLIHVLNCRSVEMNLKKVFFKQRATGWPDVLMGPVLNGLARPVNRPTDRAWACKQTRCPIGARPGGTPCQSGPCPYGPCLARARAGPCRAGPLLNFTHNQGACTTSPRRRGRASRSRVSSRRSSGTECSRRSWRGRAPRGHGRRATAEAHEARAQQRLVHKHVGTSLHPRTKRGKAARPSSPRVSALSSPEPEP